MKKYGWKLSVLVILAALVFVWLIRAPILSSYLTKKMGIGVSLRWIGLWPTHTNIHSFSVKNPHGFKGDAFKADEIVCTYTLGQLFGDPTVIDRIEVKNCVLRIDFPSSRSTDNNWTELGKTMPKNKRSSHVIIGKLVLTNLNVEIHGMPVLAKAKQTYFDRLEFDNIDSREGFPTDELVKRIFQSSGLQQYIQDFLNPVQPYLSPLKLFGP